MALLSFEIPDNPVERIAWLEQQLVSSSLAKLVAELEAVHGRRRGPTLQTVLGPTLPAVLRDGLTVLRGDQLLTLLTHPRLLLGLQEQILESGGPYWDRLVEQQQSRALGHTWARVMQHLPVPMTALSPAPPHEAPRPTPEAMPTTAAPSRTYAAVAGWTVALALCLLVGLLSSGVVPWLGPQPDGPLVAWGWAKPGALPQDVPAKEYLEVLAAGGAAWGDKVPQTQAELRNRLLEFRLGCSELLLSEHRPLAAADRQWLHDKCKEWIGRIESHLADLETGREVAIVRQEADATVADLVAHLRQRAASQAAVG